MEMPHTPRSFCLLFGLVGIAIWLFAALSGFQGSLTINKFLFHGVLGAVFWLLAGLAFTRSGENVSATMLALGMLAVTIWVIPSLIFIYSESMGIDAHLRIWSLVYLCGLLFVVASFVIRALTRGRGGQDEV